MGGSVQQKGIGKTFLEDEQGSCRCVVVSWKTHTCGASLEILFSALNTSGRGSDAVVLILKTYTLVLLCSAGGALMGSAILKALCDEADKQEEVDLSQDLSLHAQ